MLLVCSKMAAFWLKETTFPAALLGSAGPGQEIRLNTPTAYEHDATVERSTETFRPVGGGYRVNDLNILWRAAHHVLELECYSLLEDGGSERKSTRLIFPASIFPNVSWITNKNSVVAIVLCGSLLFRLTFRLPTLFRNLSERQDSWCEKFTLRRGLSATTIDACESDTVVIGCSNGSLLIVRLFDDGASEETELVEGSRLGRLVGLLLPTRQQDVIAVCTRFIQELDSTLVFALSQDRKLRLWSVRQKTCLLSTELEDVLPEAFTRNVVPKRFMDVAKAQSKPGDDPNVSKYFVAVYLPSETSGRANEGSGPSIVIYSINISRLGGVGPLEFESERAGIPRNLIDFALDGTQTLWALSEIHGLSFTSLTGATRARWQKVLASDGKLELETDVLSAIGVNSKDTRETFLDYIFYPGRFSTSVIQKVIHDYGSDLPQSGANLRALAIQCVNEATQRQFHPGTQTLAKEVRVEDMQEILREEWLGFLRKCRDAAQRASVPLGLMVDTAASLIVVVNRENTSIIRKMDGAELLFHVIRKDLDETVLLLAPQTAFDRIHGALVLPSERNLLVQFSSLLGVALSAFDERTRHDVQADFDSFLARPSPLSLRDSLNELLDSWLSESSTFAFKDNVTLAITQLNTLAGEQLASFIPDITKAVLHVLVTYPTATPESNQIAVDGSLVRTTLPLIFDQLTTARVSITYHLVLLLVLSSQLIPASNDTPDEVATTFEDYVQAAIEAYNNYRALRILHEEAKQSSDVLGDPMTLRLSSLSVSGPARPTSAPTTLLSAAYLRLCTPIRLPAPIAMSTAFTSLAIEMLHSLEVPLPSVERTPTTTVERVALFLDRSGQSTLLLRLLRQTPTRSALLLVLQARAFLFAGEHRKAEDTFLRAATNFESLKEVFPEVTSLVSFYVHVMELCESRHESALVIAFARRILALQNADKAVTDELVSRLWSKIFTSSLELHRYEDAYTAIVFQSEHSLRQDCVPLFVKAVCEDGEERRLCELPFTNMQKELENAVLFKARNAAVTLSMKPNYYKILYAIHTCRGDYRKASKAMYQYAARLVDEASHFSLPLWAEHTKSLLASLQALRLVSADNAWIACKRAIVAVPETKKRKWPELKANQPDQSISSSDVLEAVDIQKEYSLAMAKLVLAQSFHTLAETGGTLSCIEAISLLVQVGHYEHAIAIAVLFNSGLEIIIEHLTRKCVSLSLDPSAANGVELGQFGDEFAVVDTSSSNQLWEILQTYVYRHDNQQTHFKLRELVASTILASGTSVQLPSWLTQFYLRKSKSVDKQQGDPSVLLRLYLRYGYVDDALAFAISYIQDETPNKHTRAGTRWLPYTLLDQLRTHLISAQQNDSLRVLQSNLNAYFTAIHNSTEFIVKDLH